MIQGLELRVLYGGFVETTGSFLRIIYEVVVCLRRATMQAAGVLCLKSPWGHGPYASRTIAWQLMISVLGVSKFLAKVLVSDVASPEAERGWLIQYLGTLQLHCGVVRGQSPHFQKDDEPQSS